MQAALITVGDELLSGDVENTNATWLAARLADRGVSVARILVVPDDRRVIADAVARYADAFDAVIVTGGLGGTPDDVTMDAVAAAFDRDLAVDELAQADVEETVEAVRDRYPDIDIDVEAEAAVPEGARPLINGAGISPGCVVENVYVLPGIPREMEAMFEDVEGEFSGDARSRTLYTPTPEADLVGVLEAVPERFDVVIGCYPNRDEGHNRIKLTADDRSALDAATEWLEAEIETIG